VAARAASAAGGHRQALEQWEAALGADAGEVALEGVAVEAYLCGRPDRALEARRALLELHEATGETLRAGEDLRWLSRVLWWAGRGAEATAAGDRAIAVLEALPPSRELAMALSGRSQLAMLADGDEEAIELGERAIALGRRIGDREAVAHGLTNVGTALLGGPDHERGRATLEDAFALAVEAGHDDHAARALVNLATSSIVRRRDDPRAPADLERALAFASERELDGYVQYLLGARACVWVLRGEPAAAEADARASLALGEQPGVSLCPALIALGRLQARRGDPAARSTVEEAWAVASRTGELQRVGPAAALRAEHAWLEGDRAGTAAAAREAYDVALALGDPWSGGELGFWLWRAGELREPPGGATPYARSIAGDPRGAEQGWLALGFPYEAADAICDAPDPADRVRALATFDALGATRAASNLRRRLRADGVRRIPRGPRPASRSGPGGLTPRQAEVLALLAAGATNAQIAEHLVITPKTVDHHVSAVLAKLGVASRREAGAAAAGLGVRPREPA
jgi:DNA-binding CsgD family transcriptional regulator/tetratricopeptide (TPR) repeat protein